MQTTDSKALSDPPLWKEEDGWVVLDPPKDSEVVERLAKQEDWTNVHYMTRPDLAQQEKQWFREAYNSPTKLYPPEKFLLKRGGKKSINPLSYLSQHCVLWSSAALNTMILTRVF